MATYGYARSLSRLQSLDVQIEALKAAGCSVIPVRRRAAPRSGTAPNSRRFSNLSAKAVHPY